MLQKYGQKKLTYQERKKRQRALHTYNIPSFQHYLQSNGHGHSITRLTTSILQLNISLYCNQACNHCHVESSPKRTEKMSNEIINQCMKILANSPSIKTVDITGGAPELHPHFRDLIIQLQKYNIEIIDRCNLTVLTEPGQEDLPDFLAKNNVRIVASLPCYSERNVNLQRGRGVFARSIQGLQVLNEKGYGMETSNLQLDLVYNPGGAYLPPDQEMLQAQYKEKLKEDFGISFNNLFTLTNMPIKRFADKLYRSNDLERYMQLLVDSFNPAAMQGLMCRDTLSVGWDGSLFDCDFNQQLQLGLGASLANLDEEFETPHKDAQNLRTNGLTVFDINSVSDIMDKEILVDHHCFGCTAGAGSSCQGTLT